MTCEWKSTFGAAGCIAVSSPMWTTILLRVTDDLKLCPLHLWAAGCWTGSLTGHRRSRVVSQMQWQTPLPQLSTTLLKGLSYHVWPHSKISPFSRAISVVLHPFATSLFSLSFDQHQAQEFAIHSLARLNVGGVRIKIRTQDQDLRVSRRPPSQDLYRPHGWYWDSEEFAGINRHEGGQWTGSFWLSENAASLIRQWREHLLAY